MSWKRVTAGVLPLITVISLTPSVYGQARIGGGGGAGIRGGGVSMGGARGGGPGLSRGGMSRGPSRGVSGAPSRIGSRGSLRTDGLPPTVVRGRGTAEHSGGVGVGSQVPAARVGASRGSTVIFGPRNESIPPLGRSIPPLARPGTGVAPGGIRSFGGGRHFDRDDIFDFDFDRGRFFHRRGGFFQIPVAFVPLGYGRDYVDYDDPNVILIDTSTRTASNAEHVITVPTQADGKTQGKPKVVEVRPESEGAQPEQSAPDKDNQAETSVEADESVEVHRGGASAVKQDEEKPVLFLIALQNGNVHTAQEYWLEGRTLRYVTPQGQTRSAPLAEVDLDLSAQLNRERGLPFVLEVRPKSRSGNTK